VFAFSFKKSVDVFVPKRIENTLRMKKRLKQDNNKKKEPEFFCFLFLFKNGSADSYRE